LATVGQPLNFKALPYGRVVNWLCGADVRLRLVWPLRVSPISTTDAGCGAVHKPLEAVEQTASSDGQAAEALSALSVAPPKQKPEPTAKARAKQQPSAPTQPLEKRGRQQMERTEKMLNFDDDSDNDEMEDADDDVTSISLRREFQCQIRNTFSQNSKQISDLHTVH